MRVGSVFFFLVERATDNARIHTLRFTRLTLVVTDRGREGDEEGGEVGGGGGGLEGGDGKRERERERGRANKAREVSPLLTDPLC